MSNVVDESSSDHSNEDKKKTKKSQKEKRKSLWRKGLSIKSSKYSENPAANNSFTPIPKNS